MASPTKPREKLEPVVEATAAKAPPAEARSRLAPATTVTVEVLPL